MGQAAAGSSVFDTGTSGLAGLTGGGTADVFSSLLGGSSGGGSFADFGGSGSVVDALNAAYGFGDPTGSSSAQYALNQGPSATDTANQYMQGQGQQQTSPQDAQTAMDQQLQQFRQAQAQAPQDINKAYGQDLFQMGGSQQAPAGPSGWQVAGPPTTAATPPLGTQTPAGGYTPPEKSAVTSAGSPVTPSAASMPASPEQMDAAKQAYTQQMIQRGQTGNQVGIPLPQPRPSEADVAGSGYNALDAQADQVPLPQARPVAADASPAAPSRVASYAPTRSAQPPAPAVDAINRSVDPQTGQAATSQGYPQPQYQNPMQQIMQALGMGQLPPPLQQLAQQFLQMLFPGMQQFAMQGPYAGRPLSTVPWASPEQQDYYRRTGQLPNVDPQTGMAPGVQRDAQGNLTRYGRPPDIHFGGGTGQVGWEERDPSESGAPTALPPGSSGGSPAARPSVPANPPPVIRAPRDTAQASPYQVAADDVPQTPEDMLNRLRQMRQPVPPSGQMTPDQLRQRLQDIQRRTGRTMVAQAKLPGESNTDYFARRDAAKARQENIQTPPAPSGMSPAGQRYWATMQKQLLDPGATPEDKAQAQAIIQRMQQDPEGKNQLRGWGLH